MTNEDAIKWLENLKQDIGQLRHEDLWPYAQAIDEIIDILEEQETVPVKEDKINKCECGETVCRYWHPKFCGFCGRELLWY